MPVLGTALTILGEGAPFSRLVLSHRWTVFIGRISYPLYLWHWPLLVFAQLYLLRSLTAPETAGLVLAAFVLAWLTYEFVEKSFRFRKLLGVRTALTGMAATVVFAAFVLRAASAFPRGNTADSWIRPSARRNGASTNAS